MAERRVIIQWTDTARKALERLPPRARAGLLRKADTLSDHEDPRGAFKALVGPLAGYFSIKFSRYRAIYAVREEELPNGDTLIHVYVCFVAAGIRKEGDKHDVYRFAQRLLKLGVLEPTEDTDP